MYSSTVSVGDTATASQYNNARKDIVNMAGDYATSGGSANAYTLSINTQFVLAAGAKVKFKANFANTGAATLNVNSGGAVAIKINSASDVVVGDILNGQIVECVYDGTYWQMVTVGGTLQTTKLIKSFTFGENIDGTSTPQACYLKASDSKIYKTDANAGAESTWMFVGFTKDNVSTNGTGNVIIGGIVDGFSGLTTDQSYYLSDTAGAISSTPSTTNAYKVARAMSASSILIEKGAKICLVKPTMSLPSISGTADTTINTPFRPKRISIKGHLYIPDAAGMNATSTVFDHEWDETTSKGGIRFIGTGSGEITTLTRGLFDTAAPVVSPTAGTNRSSLTLTVNSVTESTAVLRLTNAIVAGSGNSGSQSAELICVIEG